MSKTFREAEQKARVRDYENNKILTDEEMAQATMLQTKAYSRGAKLVPDRIYKDRAKFVQMKQNNFKYLREIKFLTTGEKSFLVDLIPNVEFVSNCIVDNIEKKSAVPLTQSEVADILDRKKQNVNPMIKSLIDKGIIARSESGLEDNNVRSYALFINPHLMFSGDRNNIDGALKAIFHKPMRKKPLKDLPEKLW
ncbi:MarR family transcriptional regulator [Halobacillus sp. A1]|uniref:MarR family transcriptional regulator n=1 Tax=Halobacillus sp. A1 TaxID=2880262 RepID=UPI0020A695DF|nr:MarR family transcriptional regulator [Halobacillus sp. A1]MCP3033564.1 MarR family transcriptional regulator [Halobacillus sp. A1]